MSFKKTAFRIGMLALLMTGGAIAFLYFRYHKPSDLPYYIPADAEQVVFVNTKKLIMAVQSSEHKPERSFLDSIRKFKYFQNLKDPRDLGINLFSDLAYYRKKKVDMVLLQMNNESVFTAFIKDQTPKGTFNTIADKKTYKYAFAPADSIAVGWNTDVIVIILHAGRLQAAVLEQTIADAVMPKPKQSIMQQAAFKGMLEKPDALGVLYTAVPGDIRYLSDGTVKQAAGYLSLKQKTLELQGIVSFGNVSETDVQQLAPLTTDTTAGKVCLQIDPTAPFVRNWIDKYHHAMVVTTGEKAAGKQDEKNYINILSDVFKGPLQLVYMGNTFQQTSFTTYEYDDNFNKIERVTVKTDTLPAFNAFFNVNDNNVFASFFNAQGYKDLYFFNNPEKHNGPCCITNNKAYNLSGIDKDVAGYKTVPNALFHADIDIARLQQVDMFRAVNTGNLRHIYITFAASEKQVSRFVVSLQFSGSPFLGISRAIKNKRSL